MRKNTSRVEIIITVSIENRIKCNKNFGHVLRAIFIFIVIISRYFCAYDVILSYSQPSLGTRSSNGDRKLSEIKVKKE